MRTLPQLPTARLASGYEIPRLIVGTWQLSEGHYVDPQDADELIASLMSMAEAGLIAFDCADIYTGVEERLGQFLHRYRGTHSKRNGSEIRIHTKFVPDRDALPTVTKAYTERIIDRSLQRLGVERLDLVQFAWWDYAVPRYVETAMWLQELVHGGKIRHLGATNFDAPRLAEIVDAGVPIVSNQVQYSLLDRRPQWAMVQLCREREIQLLSYGALAGGFLSVRWLGESEPTGLLSNRSLIKYKLIIDEFGGWTAFQKLLTGLHDIAIKHVVSVSNVAVRYVLNQMQVAAVILGARNLAHLQDNLRALTLELDDDDMDRVKRLTEGHGPTGPVFGLERAPNSEHAAIMRYNLNNVATND